MMFNPELYFYGLGGNISDIPKYNSRFNEGILICDKILYYLVFGNYAERCREQKKDVFITTEEQRSYGAIVELLKKIRGESDILINLYITPHIFTKFIHLLKEKDKSGDHFKFILDTIQEDLGYIIEEDIKKEKFIKFDNFRNTSLGLSESSILILKERKNPPCILCCNPKLLHSYDNEFLYINFDDLVSFSKEYTRRNKIE